MTTINIETDGTAEGTKIVINGEAYNDITDFCFLAKSSQGGRLGKAKLQMKRSVSNAPVAMTHLYGNDFRRFDEEISPGANP